MAILQHQEQTCNTCGDGICKPVTNDCLCQFSSIRIDDMCSYTPAIIDANVCMNDCLCGIDVCDLLTDPFTEIKDSFEFKRLYFLFFEEAWYCRYGYGSGTEVGSSYKKSESFQVSAKVNDRLLAKTREAIPEAKAKLKQYLINEGYCEEEEKKSDCGCRKKNCGCARKNNCGCKKADCNICGRGYENEVNTNMCHAPI